MGPGRGARQGGDRQGRLRAGQGGAAGRARKLEAAAKPKFAAGDQVGVEALLPRLEQVDTLSDRLANRGAEIDAEIARVEGVVAGMGAGAPAGAGERLAAIRAEKKSAWPAGKTLDALETSLDAFDAKLKAVVDEIDGAKKSADAKVDFEKARAAAQADLDAAAKIRTDKPASLGGPLQRTYDTAKKAVDDAVAKPDWPKALAAFPALRTAAAKVRQAAAAHAPFEAAYAKIRADVLAGRNLATAEAPMPGSLVKDFLAADKAVNDEMAKGNWGAALPLVAPLAAKTKALLANVADGKVFYDELRPNLPIRQAARDAFNSSFFASMTENPTMRALGFAFHEADSNMNADAEAREWKDAKKKVPAMRAAAIELVNAKVKWDAGSKPFLAALAKVVNRFKAEAAAEKAAPAIAAEAAALLKLRTQMFAEADAGRFDKAMALIPAYEAAVADVLNADKAHGDAKTAFEAAYKALNHYAEANALTANQTEPLKAPIKAFQDADRVVERARKIENWPAANNALPPLQAAIDALVKAGADVNAAFSEADATALQARVDALKPRTEKALEAPATKHIDGHQKSVVAQARRPRGTLRGERFRHRAGRGRHSSRALTRWSATRRATANHRKFDAREGRADRRSAREPIAPPKLAAQRAHAMAEERGRDRQARRRGQTSRPPTRRSQVADRGAGLGRVEGSVRRACCGKPSVDTLEKL